MLSLMLFLSMFMSYAQAPDINPPRAKEECMCIGIGKDGPDATPRNPRFRDIEDRPVRRPLYQR